MIEIFSKKLHNKGIISIDYNKDSNEILSTSWDNRLKIYNIEKEDFSYDFSMKATIFNAKFLKNPFTIINSGKDIITLDSNEKISLLKLKRTNFSVDFKKENNLFDVSNFDELGNIAVLEQNSNIHYFSLNSPKQIVSFSCFENKADRRIKVFINGKNLILLYRENRIGFLKIFDLEDGSLLFKADNCLNYNNISFYENFIAGSTEKGEVEIWDLKSFKKTISFKEKEEVCSILIHDKKLYLGLRSGHINKIDLASFTFSKKKAHEKRVSALLIKDEKLFSASEDGVLKIHKIDEEKVIDFDKDRAKSFIEKYNIDISYIDFFNEDRIKQIEDIFSSISNYNPKEENVFKALEYPIANAKILILGQDPYPQAEVATGLSFEVGGLNSWIDTFRQSSLRNILRLLYHTYKDEFLKLTEIRKEIENNNFHILAPNKLFKYWHANGIILINSILTCEINTPASHANLWLNLVKDLMTFISFKNRNIKYILWGKTAQEYEKIIFSNDFIKSNHPSRINMKNKEDFMNSKSFSSLKNKINWLGVENDTQ